MLVKSKVIPRAYGKYSFKPINVMNTNKMLQPNIFNKQSP
jgi:hypothetical protein